jgi:regulator of protease activity HflC (stomatin/prohibitin superfamily)
MSNNRIDSNEHQDAPVVFDHMNMKTNRQKDASEARARAQAERERAEAEPQTYSLAASDDDRCEEREQQ